MRLSLVLVAALALTGCERGPETDLDRPATAREFPRPDRPVSDLGQYSVATEQARDDRNEATTVMDLAAIQPGMTVADIGAGEGYYTVRLAERVGAEGAFSPRTSTRMPSGGSAPASKMNALTMSRSSWGLRTIPGCPRTASTACSWFTCTTR